MLANNEPVQGLNLESVLERMLQELPWKSLKNYIQANSELLKLCTGGGYRLDVKHRQRLEQLILKEAKRAEFAPAFCNGVFAQWYPVHESLHKSLEDYFHSDEYKKYREEKELDEDTYVLPDDVFDRFFNVQDLEKWRALLAFSPLQFSEEQAKKIMSDAEGNVDLLRRIREMEEARDAAKQEEARLQNENNTLRRQLDQATADAQELRQARKALTTERDGLDKKFELSQAEAKRLREQLAQAEAEAQKAIDEQGTRIRRELQQTGNDLKRSEKELVNWRQKYEEQRGENRQLKRDIEQFQRQLMEQRSQIKERGNTIEELHGFADLILSRIDWPKVGAQLKLTTTLKRQFNSLIKKLNYEEDRTLTIEGTLPEFWERLLNRERDLVSKIAESNTLEVMEGDVEGFWRGLTDVFEDVHIGLEARVILLRMIQEIFYQVIEMEDLETPVAKRSSK